MIGVLGGGFGLYGHLPAVLNFAPRVGTLARYEEDIVARRELSGLRSQIDFFENEEALIAASSVLVLARRPRDNVRLAVDITARGADVRRLVLEKPVAPTPNEALVLHGLLQDAQLPYATPYLFAYCDWAQPISDLFSSDNRAEVDIEWRHAARNAPLSWKYAPGEGGGAFRFYNIHFLALASDIAVRNGLELNDLRLNVHGDDMILELAAERRRLRVVFTLTRETPDFHVSMNRELVYRATTPFGPLPQRGAPDPRIACLERFYADRVFASQANEMFSGNEAVLRNWMRLEKAEKARRSL